MARCYAIFAQLKKHHCAIVLFLYKFSKHGDKVLQYQHIAIGMYKITDAQLLYDIIDDEPPVETGLFEKVGIVRVVLVNLVKFFYAAGISGYIDAVILAVSFKIGIGKHINIVMPMR